MKRETARGIMDWTCRHCGAGRTPARRRDALLVALALCAPALLAQPEPPHPILTISGSGSGAGTILSTWTEEQYTNNFTPRLAPRNDDYGFVPPVVSGDTGWSWNSSAPNQITSTPSGTVFPNGSYTVLTEAVTVMNGNTVNAPYYLRAGSATAKSLVFNLIAHNQRSKLRSDFNALAPAYMNSGATHATRNQSYARRIAIALLDWARYFPDYTLTAKNSASFIDTGPSYILGSDLQRASDHNGLAHEWADDELLAFDAIYDSPALANLSVELGFDVRDYIRTNLFYDEGDFIVYHVPPEVATDSNLSGPYTVLALVARVLNRPDYIEWMDRYLGITVREKIHRDGALSEGMGYSIGYINENENAATYTRNYFLTRPADTAQLQAISNRAGIYVNILTYGQQQWSRMALPNGQLPSFGDTPFNTYFTARNAGLSALLPSYGTVSMGAGSSSGTAVQLNQNFSGDNNHMRSDTCAYTLWAFGNEVLGNVRYHNGTPGRQFTEQILAYNAVTIDRVDMSSPSANTYGNGDLTLYEPGNNGLAVTEIDGQRAYNNKASRYQRLMMLNTFDLNRPYVVDVFRVTGGTTHDYVWHGSIRYDQTAQCSFGLVTNNSTYPMLEGSEVWSEPTSSGDSFPYYGFWRNVNSNTAPGDFQISYLDASRSSPRDTKLWMTASPGDFNVYLGRTPVPSRANGEPADWWVNGLWRPSTLIRKRIPSGTLHDLFVSVIEPLKNGVGTIQSVERLPMNGSSLESCTLRITFTDGRVDTCVVNLRNPQVAGANTGSATVATTNGQYSLTGRVGVYTEGPAGSRAWAVNATQFNYPGGAYTPTNLYYSGQIIGETRKLTGGGQNAFITTSPLPTGTTLRGKPLSLTFGPLSGSGTTGISEMFEIDQVVFTNSQYRILFTNDHQLEITDALTVNGSGSDIWGTADQFHYAYQPVTGDLTLTAHVLSQNNPNAWAKSGVMFRESTAANASYVGVYVTPGNGVSMQYRNGTGTSAIDLARQSGLAAPYWVRLVRSTNSFTGYSSPDGVTWTELGQANVAMAAAATAGLAVCSHNNAALNTTAFDNISLSPLTDLDIGAVGLAGGSSYSMTSFEQMGPLRTFTGTNQFEIALSGTQSASVPGAPTGLAAIPGNTQVLLNWNANGALSYNVKRSTTNGGPYAAIGNPALPTFTDSGLTNGVTYFYVVSALNEAGEGPTSAQASATPSAVAPTGMVARLTFDDGTANDSSGYGNHGTLVNGAAIATDATRGKVLSLDGANDYVDLGNGASLNLSDNNQATILAWVKLAVSQNHNTILSKGEWKEAYSVVVKGDTVPDDQLWTGNDTSVFSGNSVPLNTWTHVAVVINGDLTTFYLNGQLSGTPNQDRGNPIDNTAVGVSIGREQYSGSLPAGRWFFNGQMDDVRIYERALSQAEIQSAMVDSVNAAPSFTSNPLNKPAAIAGQAYAGSIAGDATDPNAGDTLTFSRLSGPAWLSVAANGALSGMPLSADVGTNSFVIRVTDPGNLFGDAVLNLMVTPAPQLLAAISVEGDHLLLSWSGGVPPYQVQMNTNLTGTNWQNLGGPLSTNRLLISPSNTAEFYRVQGQ